MIYLSVEPTIRTVICSPPANETDFAPRVSEFLRQEHDSALPISGRIDSRSCGACSEMPELLRALKDGATVRAR